MNMPATTVRKPQMRHWPTLPRITSPRAGTSVGRAGGRIEIFQARGGRHRFGADHLKIDKAHIVGFQWAGSPPALGFGIPPALSLVVAGCGYGRQASDASGRGRLSRIHRRQRHKVFAEKYAYGPTRVQFENKDPRFAEFKQQLAEHSKQRAEYPTRRATRAAVVCELVDDMKN
jgi:hypothetical protein